MYTGSIAFAIPSSSLLVNRDFNPLPDDPSNGPVSVEDLTHDINKKCGSNTYGYTEIYAAVAWGIKLREKGIGRGQKSKDFPVGRFPHKYDETKFDFGKNCPPDDNHQEYPLITSGPYNGGISNNKQWGPDRVVYYHEPGEVGSNGDPIGYYCGSITHTGANEGEFLQCS